MKFVVFAGSLRNILLYNFACFICSSLASERIPWILENDLLTNLCSIFFCFFLIICEFV